jgi:hypothetical protein
MSKSLFFTAERKSVLDTPYYVAARFPNKQKAGDVYFPLQQYIFAVKDECDLSVYRFKHKGTWYVVVIGEKPPDSLHTVIEAKLTNGILTTVDADVLSYLMQRRSEAIQLGPWVEGHYQHEEDE